MSNDPRHEAKRRWRLSHPDSVYRSNKKQYWKNKGKKQKLARLYRQANKDRIAKKMREYHRKRYPLMRDKILIQTKLYAQSHPEVRRRCFENYRRNNPEKYRLQVKSSNAKYKARKRNAIIGSSASSLIKSWAKAKSFVCHYCQKRFPIHELTVDHVLSISKGGKHEASNLAKCCKTCNPSKGNRSIHGFCKNSQLLLL